MRSSRLKRADAFTRQFHTILSSPHMYPSIHLSSFPPPPPTLLALIPTLLPGAFSLKLRSFSYLTLRPLLSHIEPSRLTSLDLSFSGVADGDLLDLSDRGALDCVKVLRLKGCSAVRDGEWLARDTTLPRVEVVDLSWSGVESLPGTRIDHHLQQEVYHHPDDSGFFDLDDETETKPTVYWPSLRHLSLSSLPYLPTMSLVSFFTTVLPTLSHLSTLDLSHLGIAAKDVRTLAAALKDCKALKMLDVGGNDCLTLESVECLKRARCGSGKRQDDRAESDGDDEETRRELNVIHSALLESEDEVHVRKFVMMVAGVVSRAS